MQTTVIQRQYDEIIASYYDFDPHAVIGDSLDWALGQIKTHLTADGSDVLQVLDLGVGTGRFLEKLRGDAGLKIRPFGVDLSRAMIDIARARIPDLVAAIEDAANLENHFRGQTFDLACTHFLTGFVPLGLLAPQVTNKLKAGGWWTFVGGTRQGFPVLQAKANSEFFQELFDTSGFDVGQFVCNPTDEQTVVAELKRNGLAVRACETFRPTFRFQDLTEFLEFAYYGGWLTPFIESLGLDQPTPLVRTLLNQFFFPVRDQHAIVIALAQKETGPPTHQPVAPEKGWR
jgi:SAM-dependent methyltransferase